MSIVRVQTALTKEMCDALGLKDVTKIDLHFSVDALVTADVTFRVDPDDLQKLPPILKRYVLTEQKP